MSVETSTATVLTDVKNFFTGLVADFKKAKAIWTAITNPQIQALFVKLGTDAITLVKDSASAAESTGLNLALDAQVVSDVKTIIADAKAGEPTVVSTLAALGIKL